jgi:hypothetical protein
MTARERQIIRSVLISLTDVSYTALIEAKRNNNTPENEIELLEAHRITLRNTINELNEE